MNTDAFSESCFGFCQSVFDAADSHRGRISAPSARASAALRAAAPALRSHRPARSPGPADAGRLEAGSSASESRIRIEVHSLALHRTIISERYQFTTGVPKNITNTAAMPRKRSERQLVVRFFAPRHQEYQARARFPAPSRPISSAAFASVPEMLRPSASSSRRRSPSLRARVAGNTPRPPAIAVRSRMPRPAARPRAKAPEPEEGSRTCDSRATERVPSDGFVTRLRSRSRRKSGIIHHIRQDSFAHVGEHQHDHQRRKNRPLQQPRSSARMRSNTPRKAPPSAARPPDTSPRFSSCTRGISRPAASN